MSAPADWHAILIGIAAALWTVVTGLVLALGLWRIRLAASVRARAALLGTMLAAAPALSVIVRSGGAIEADARLARWLGLDTVPARIDELGGERGGLSPEDLAGLSAAIDRSMRTAAPLSLRVGVCGSDRRLRIVGGPAPAGLAGDRTLLLWIYDATEAGQTIRDLTARVGELGDALDALAALIEAAPIPMWHRGSDLRLSLVNSAYVRAVEAQSAAEVIARGMELVETSGGGNPLNSAALARAENRIEARSAPATIAGERRMLQIVDVPLGTAGVAGYAVDIEELEQARADLARFGRAQRDMLDRISAGVAQFAPDHSLVFTNQPFQRMFAMQPEWLVDRPEFDRVLERMREARRLPESRDFRSWKAERRSWFTSPDAPIEESWLLPGGTHLRVLAQSLPDGGLMLVFEDRTEQLRLASARDTLLRVRTATFDNLFEAIGVFAADGRLALWNSRFRDVWGLDEALLSRHPRVDALVDIVAPKLSNPARANLIRELVRIATLDRQQRSGRVDLSDGRTFEFAAVPLPDGNALFTMLDVTDSRRVEAALRGSNEALEEADRVKTAFVAGMSYELRTPLTSIGGFAEMLAAGYAGELTDTQRDYVKAILESVDRLGLLIDDVLDLTQSEDGGLPIEPEEVQVADLLRSAAQGADHLGSNRGIAIGVTVDPLAGTIAADRQRLTGALAAIADHAVARSADGGRVTITASGTATRAEIAIRDEGEAIDAAALARLFTRFPQRVDGQPDHALPPARRIIEAHGGTLDAAAGTDRGVVVTVLLPRMHGDG